MKKQFWRWSVLTSAMLPAGFALTVPSHAEVVFAEWIGPSPGAWSMAKRWSGGVVPWNTEFTRFQVSITDDGGAPSSVEITTGVPVIDTLALGAGAQLSIAPGAGLEVFDGLIANDGAIVLEDVGAGSVSQLRLGAGETLLDGAGVITGNGLRARIGGTDQTSRLINGPSHALRGSMWLGESQSIRLTNYGVIEADSAGPLAIALRAGTSEEPNVNTGVMRAIDGGTLWLYLGGTIDNHGGVIEAGPGSTVRVGHPTSPGAGGNIRVSGGVIRDADGDGPGRIDVGHGTLALVDGVIVEGAIHVGAVSGGTAILAIGEATSFPSSIRLSGEQGGGMGGAMLGGGAFDFVIANCTVTGVGTLAGAWTGNKCVVAETASLSGSFSVRFGFGFENHGNLDIIPKGRLMIVGGTSINHTSGVIRMSTPPTAGLGLCIWYVSFHNHGLVDVAPLRHVTIQAAQQHYRQMAGMTVLHGSLTIPISGMLIITGGALTGSGECVGFVNHAGGLIAPEGVDGSPAAFTITGSLMQGSDAEVEIDVDAGEDPEASASDSIVVSGHATLAGTLRVRLADGFQPAFGDSFTVLTAGSIEGTFESIDSCLPVDVVYSAGSVSVVFTASSPADLSGDGVVDGNDLSILLGSWGPCAAKCCLGDVDRDGEVCGTDLAFLLGAWGA